LIEKLAGEIVPRLSPGAILTDVGSTKTSICRTVTKLLADAQVEKAAFIGSHPLAGSEQRGIDAATDGLFEGALCVLVATEATNDACSEKIRAMWHALGARTLELTPEEHDRRLARVSHLVHFAAAALVNAADEESLSVASTGFLDTTRVASGDPDLWKEIALSNREMLAAALEEYAASVEKLRRALKNSSAEEIRALLSQAKRRRDALVEEVR